MRTEPTAAPRSTCRPETIAGAEHLPQRRLPAEEIGLLPRQVAGGQEAAVEVARPAALLVEDDGAALAQEPQLVQVDRFPPGRDQRAHGMSPAMSDALEGGERSGRVGEAADEVVDLDVGGERVLAHRPAIVV